jgi:transcriptional regulator with XRE-family HTH domain
LVSFCSVNQKGKDKYFKDAEALKLIGVRIREIRTIKKISQETLANSCDIDYSQVNRMELGKVNFGISYLFRIAQALEVDPKDLLT